jgi:hypothetical protein
MTRRQQVALVQAALACSPSKGTADLDVKARAWRQRTSFAGFRVRQLRRSPNASEAGAAAAASPYPSRSAGGAPRGPGGSGNVENWADGEPVRVDEFRARPSPLVKILGAWVPLSI